MEEELIKRYNDGLWLFFACTIAFLLVVLTLFLMRNKLLQNVDKSFLSKILLYFIIFIFLLIDLSFAFRLSLYVKDYEAVNRGEFEYITATVIDYGRAVSVGGDIAVDTHYHYPIVKDIDSDYLIKLDCIGTELSETYTFIYLKNSRVALIVEQVDHEQGCPEDVKGTSDCQGDVILVNVKGT